MLTYYHKLAICDLKIFFTQSNEAKSVSNASFCCDKLMILFKIWRKGKKKKKTRSNKSCLYELTDFPCKHAVLYHTHHDQILEGVAEMMLRGAYAKTEVYIPW